ncbi:MAG: TrkH family potassium uptake protein, partial [Kiritimatiellae bacterium]|nr:TrkH family potassium uptake protein [Kiritimatiellia bacterium]
MPRMIAYVLAIIGTSLMPPFITALIYGEQRSIIAFVVPMAVSWVVAFAFWMHRHVDRRQLGVYDAFALVGSVWISICLFGSLPLYLCGNFASFTDAVFESVSGFTTTGASIVLDVESLPRSINLWRCMTHWLGGMGVIALVVAIMPLLGIGGFKLFKAEMTGPDKFKVASRISTNAKVLWFIYFGMTFLQTALLRYSGMDWFDSACHSFSMVGSGGFSTRNASIGAFNNVAAEWICVVFMFLAGVNYSLYFQLFVGKVGDLFRDSELRAYFSIVILAIAAVTVLELRQFGSFAEAVRNSAFQVSALISTTGFITSDYANWVPGAQMILLTLFIVGGCSGSTAGGVKVVRWVVLGKQLANEISRLLHPHGIFTIRINGMPGRDGIVPIEAAFVF